MRLEHEAKRIAPNASPANSNSNIRNSRQPSSRSLQMRAVLSSLALLNFSCNPGNQTECPERIAPSPADSQTLDETVIEVLSNETDWLVLTAPTRNASTASRTLRSLVLNNSQPASGSALGMMTGDLGTVVARGSELWIVRNGTETLLYKHSKASAMLQGVTQGRLTLVAEASAGSLTTSPLIAVNSDGTARILQQQATFYGRPKLAIVAETPCYETLTRDSTGVGSFELRCGDNIVYESRDSVGDSITGNSSNLYYFAQGGWNSWEASTRRTERLTEGGSSAAMGGLQAKADSCGLALVFDENEKRLARYWSIGPKKPPLEWVIPAHSGSVRQLRHTKSGLILATDNEIFIQGTMP